MTFQGDANESASLLEEELDKRKETDALSEPDRKMPLHSGLSALIQAATTQLGQLDQANLQQSRDAGGEHVKSPPPEGSRSNGAALADNTTPTLGPESTEVRQQTFPEVLMTLLEDKDNSDVITFLPDGKFFAIRKKEFSETTMINYFTLKTFEEFLGKIRSWGFSRIDRNNKSGIEIFRHPLFVRGEWEKCSRICFGETPTDARLSALPQRTRIEYTLSDESTLGASKRRLSPSHAKKESDASTTTSKLKLDAPDISPPSVTKTESADTQDSSDTKKAEEDFRCLALSITTEKMNVRGEADEEADRTAPLVERAVENATHTIVTDAIETLLRDEGHTRETYLKHERELSRSSLPGVVPISKQLFEPKSAEPPAGAKVEVSEDQDEGKQKTQTEKLVSNNNNNTGVATST